MWNLSGAGGCPAGRLAPADWGDLAKSRQMINEDDCTVMGSLCQIKKYNGIWIIYSLAFFTEKIWSFWHKKRMILSATNHPALRTPILGWPSFINAMWMWMCHHSRWLLLGHALFHSWHKYISVKPIISFETTDICELLVQFCKPRFEGSPTMDSGKMMLFLGWVGNPQATCVKTIRWSRSIGSISGVVTSTNSVACAPRGAPAKMDNYSTDIDFILLLEQNEWMQDFFENINAFNTFYPSQRHNLLWTKSEEKANFAY